MAAGNQVMELYPFEAQLLGKNGMYRSDRSGHDVLVAPNGRTTKAIWKKAPNHLYAAGTGMTFTIVWSSDVAAGNAQFTVEVERHTANAAGFNDMADNFAAAIAATAAANGTVGRLNYTAVALTAAEADALAAKELARIRIGRLKNASDTLEGEVYIHGIICTDT